MWSPATILRPWISAPTPDPVPFLVRAGAVPTAPNFDETAAATGLFAHRQDSWPWPWEHGHDPKQPFPNLRAGLNIAYPTAKRTPWAVYYATISIFRTGRSELIRALGLGYGVVEERGISPVREATCRYLLRPAMTTSSTSVPIVRQTRASLYFTYEITNEDRSTLLTRGSTQHAVINDQGRPVRIPQWFAEMLTGGQIRKKQDE